MSINRVIVSGNLTRDPELRSTGSGTSILQLGIAVNDRTKVEGEWTDRINFFDAVVFGRRAESLASLLAKGAKVAIEGKLRWSTWEKDGEKRTKVEIIVDELELMSTKGERQSLERELKDAFPGADVSVLDEDIPF